MRGFLSLLALAFTIGMVPIVVAIVLDYGDHIRNSREVRRLTEASQAEQDRTMLEICKNYRAFQRMPEGRDTHSMDGICDDLESRLK